MLHITKLEGNVLRMTCCLEQNTAKSVKHMCMIKKVQKRRKKARTLQRKLKLSSWKVIDVTVRLRQQCWWCRRSGYARKHINLNGQNNNERHEMKLLSSWWDFKITKTKKHPTENVSFRWKWKLSTTFIIEQKLQMNVLECKC